MKTFIILIFISLSFSSGQNQRICRTADELAAALKNAVPGTSIIVENGTYSLTALETIEVKGTKNTPVLIKARNRNKVIITGPASLVLRNSSFITVEGFIFENENSNAIRLEGSNNIHITRNIFRLKEKGRGSWILVTGNAADTLSLSHHNIMDRNLFEKKKELGNFITIEGTKKFSSAVSQYDVIEWNHFRDIGPRAENVLEAIRAGSSEYTLSRGYTQIRNNLFERCDGDPEYISIKMSDCTVLGNTFFECLGSLSLRHGNHSTVKDNVILGNGRTGTFLDSTGKTWTLGTGGIRFCADSMTITGNYLEGLTGSGWDATIAATNGDADYTEKKPLTKHYRITNAVLANNVMVNNAGGLEIGFDGAGFQANWWSKAPEKMLVKNNIIVGSSDTLVKMMDPSSVITFEGNLLFAQGSAVASSVRSAGLTVADPKLKKVDGFLLPNGSKKHYSLRRLSANDVGPNSK
ncbi:MAG: polysaccharide lyase 6 family protein [Bacteroidota bacterium]